MGAGRTQSGYGPTTDRLRHSRSVRAARATPASPQARRRVVVEAREEAADDVLQLAHAVGAEQHRLVVGDVVLERAHLEEVERAQVGAAELLDLAVGGEDAGAVGAHLAVLAQDAELDREPEDVGEELQRLVGLDALGGEARPRA